MHPLIKAVQLEAKMELSIERQAPMGGESGVAGVRVHPFFLAFSLSFFILRSEGERLERTTLNP